MSKKTAKQKLKGRTDRVNTSVSPALALKTPTGRTRSAPPKLFAVTRSTQSAPANGIIPPKQARTKQFGATLQTALVNKGIRQIRLAELTGIGRDSISGYCNGKNIPGNDNLKKIADVLEMKPEELLPTYGADTSHADNHPAFLIRQTAGGEDLWLTINRPIPFIVASKIMELMKEADAIIAKRKKPKGS